MRSCWRPGLYLQLGMHNEAGPALRGAAGATTCRCGVRNSAWFYLAKIWYERGYYDRSEQALARIQGTADAGARGRAQQSAGQCADARAALRRGDRAPARAGRARATGWPTRASTWVWRWCGPVGLPEADPILTSVGSTADSNSAELLDLRDKANLALGFAYLQANQARAARASPLERVRLDGPYSSRALLGAGWAQAGAGRVSRGAGAVARAASAATCSMRQCRSRTSRCPMPSASSTPAAQAAEYYETALKSFADESRQSRRRHRARIHDGHMLDDLLGADKDAQLWLVLAAEGAARCAAVALSLHPAGRQRFSGRPEELSRPGFPASTACALGRAACRPSRP